MPQPVQDSLVVTALGYVVSEERSSMKKNRSAGEKANPAKPTRAMSLPQTGENTSAFEARNLSPERIRDGACCTTPLLNEILAQNRELPQLRGWSGYSARP